MIMKKYFFLLLIFTTFNVSADNHLVSGSGGNYIVSGDTGDYLVLGTGGKSCGAFLENKKKEQLIHSINMSWVLGYITGYNKTLKKVVGSNIDVPAMSQYLINYCEKNTLDSLESAAADLIKALEK